MQVDTERRYAGALHQAVKRLMEPLAPELGALLAPPALAGAPAPLRPHTPRQRADAPARPPAGAAEEAAPRCAPLLAALGGHLGALAPLLDGRVLRRAAREAWNCVAAVRQPPPHPPPAAARH